MTLEKNLLTSGVSMARIFNRLICRFSSHRWGLDTGVCARCGKICLHKVAILDLRWRRGMCRECCSLMPPRKATVSWRKVG